MARRGFARVAQRRFQLIHHRASFAMEYGACIGQLNAPFRAFEESDAEVALEHENLLAQGWLSHAQDLGSAPEVQLVRKDQKLS